jgi:23S rRNA U2552 (ribose-2'-O)-methylase RlmE/FtsJ
MYQPFVFKLPNIILDSKTITSDDNNIEISNIKPYPYFTLGFHSFIHRTRNAMDIIKNLQTKIEFYFVVNPFENNISNYNDDLISSTETYLKSNIKYSNEFQKLWEVLFVFDITSNNQTIQIIGDNELEDCIKLFKEKTSKTNSKDKFVLDKEIKKGNYNLIINNLKKKVIDNNFFEQETYYELLETVISIINNLSDNGNTILQLYDTFTISTIKLIYILQSCFEESYIYKPYMSRHSDNEKYIILKNFKTPENNVIKGLENAYKNYDNKKYLIDIFPKLIISKDYLNIFKFINIKLINYQQIMINDIVKYIKENNYFGDKYHIYRDKQIESTKWWISNFYPPSVNLYEKNKDELDKLFKNSQEKLKLEYQKFVDTLV